MVSTKEGITWPFFTSSILALLGSFLFGFYSGVISGALLFINREYSFSHWHEGVFVSLFVLGAVFGALLGGYLSDLIGRKKSFFLAGVIFLISVYFTTGINHLVFIFIGRVFLGFAVGLVSVVVPLYLSEISQTKFRGVIVSFNQLLIVFGVFVSFGVNYYLSFTSSWRMMFLIGTVPAVFLLIGSYFMTESPIWFLSKGMKEKAKRSFAVLSIKHKTKKQKDVSHKEGLDQQGKRSLLKITSKEKKALFIGISISILQQVTGINIIIYYAPKLLKINGLLDTSDAFLSMIFLGFIQLIAAILALFLIKKYSRKSLLKLSSLGMGVGLVLLAFSFTNFTFQLMPILSMVLYLFFFSIGLGPITWVLISEIFDVNFRGKGVGISAFFNWSTNFVISLFFAPMLHWFDAKNIFYCVALLCVVAYFFTLKYVPETKNKSFKEIQNQI